jgi:hypothetical protein
MTMVQKIFGYGEFGIKARMLKDYAEASPHGMGILPKALAEDLCLSASRRQQRGKDLEQGGLPSTVRAKEGEEFSRKDSKGHAGKGCTGTILAAEVCYYHSRDRIHWPGFLLRITSFFLGAISAGLNR